MSVHCKRVTVSVHCKRVTVRQFNSEPKVPTTQWCKTVAVSLTTLILSSMFMRVLQQWVIYKMERQEVNSRIENLIGLESLKSKRVLHDSLCIAKNLVNARHLSCLSHNVAPTKAVASN